MGPLPKSVRSIVVHRCAGCGKERATYEGSLPRRWIRSQGGQVWCGRSSGRVRCAPARGKAVSR